MWVNYSDDILLTWISFSSMPILSKLCIVNNYR